MALGEAKTKAKAEFQGAIESTGRALDDIRSFVAERRDLRRPFYHVPHVKGVTGTAAQFVLHVNELMSRQRRSRTRPRLLDRAAM
jgi:hypothetical protein